MLRIALTHPLGQAALAAVGATLALLPFRRRLRSWDVITLSRTALVGGLAGAIWSPSTHVMYWLSRAEDVMARVSPRQDDVARASASAGAGLGVPRHVDGNT